MRLHTGVHISAAKMKPTACQRMPPERGHDGRDHGPLRDRVSPADDSGDVDSCSEAQGCVDAGSCPAEVGCAEGGSSDEIS